MKTVLMVDDEEGIRDFLATALKKIGYNVVETGSGKEAIRLFGEIKPDYVLLDKTLLDIDGLVVLKEIKATDKDAKIIMMSAKHTVNAESLKDDIIGFIEKPMGYKAFMEEFEYIVSGEGTREGNNEEQ